MSGKCLTLFWYPAQLTAQVLKGPQCLLVGYRSSRKAYQEKQVHTETLTDELAHKLELKRLGGDDFKAESMALLVQVEARLSGLDANKKEDKKKITVLEKNKAALGETHGKDG